MCTTHTFHNNCANSLNTHFAIYKWVQFRGNADTIVELQVLFGHVSCAFLLLWVINESILSGMQAHCGAYGTNHMTGIVVYPIS